MESTNHRQTFEGGGSLGDFVCQVGEHQHHWHIDVHDDENFHTYQSVKLKHDEIWGWGIYDLNGWGIYGLST